MYVYVASCPECDHTQDLVRFGVLTDKVRSEVHPQVFEVAKVR